MPFKWAYNQADKRFNQADKIADKLSSGADSLLGFLSGDSNALLYIGIGIVAIIALPIILKQVV